MKKIFLSFLMLGAVFTVKADEGMWIPMLIGKNYEDMKRMGLKLTAEDLYSVNNASMKDAIVHFGGGCTGEIISPNGLLITNHHCGYGNIADLSTVEKNYLENGFWAKSYSEEIHAPGLQVKFLVNMRDVTTEVTKVLDKAKSDEKKQEAFKKIKEELEKAANEGGKYSATVSSYFNGNQYILLTYQVFTDVRLVGTPPKSLGKYGGDTDNWMWPRHTADFSMFRVYADKDNNPAAYSPGNVPYKPKKFLPVSTQGVKENDFTMVMGYPGRTNRYETSYGVDLSVSETNPSTVKIRDMRLSIMRNQMRKDPAVNLKLASSYASIANYWKYYIGQTEQLKRLNVVEEKQTLENNFTNWAKGKKEYDNLMKDFSGIYNDYRPYARHTVYYSECFQGSAVARLAVRTKKLSDLLNDKKRDTEAINKEIADLKKARAAAMKSFVPAVEQEMLARTAEMFYKDVPQSQLPDFYKKFIFKQFANNNEGKAFNDFANYVFLNSFLTDEVKFDNFCGAPTKEKLDADPAIQYALSFAQNFEDNYKAKYEQFANERAKLAKKYVKGLMEQNDGKLMYPDANSTMRLTYGTVSGYNPQDAVSYDYYTIMDGLLAKYKPNDYEFDLPADFLELARAKDFGRYANENGDLVTCFISNNDITGGNSGSPVINANGELLGLAFDGNWEAMSGDIAFDKKYKRTIVVDSRFVLWLIDKYGGATNLINEMTIR